MFGPAKRQCRTRGRSKRTNLSIELNQSFETFNAVTRGMAIVHLACGFFVPAIVVRHWASKMPCGRSASYTNTRRQGSTSHMWMHAASDAPFQEKDEGFRLFCARLQARMVRGMPENDAYVEEAGSFDCFNLHDAFCLSFSLCLEALKHPVKRKICEDPKLDTYVREAR